MKTADVKQIAFDEVAAKLLPQKTMMRMPIKPQPSYSQGGGYAWKGCDYGVGMSVEHTKYNFIKSQNSWQR